MEAQSLNGQPYAAPAVPAGSPWRSVQLADCWTLGRCLHVGANDQSADAEPGNAVVRSSFSTSRCVVFPEVCCATLPDSGLQRLALGVALIERNLGMRSDCF